MTALIATGGEGPSPQFLADLASSADIFIAADSGLDAALEAGISPDLVLGDFDSLSDRRLLTELRNAQIMQFESAKDDTDTELALDEAARRGFDRILLCGAGGGRLDHLMGILELYKRLVRPAEWYTKAESIHLVAQESIARFRLSVGDLVSVFPLGSPSSGMYSEGLKWPLAGLEWGPGKFGISNIAQKTQVSIKAGTVDLLVVLPAATRRLAQD